MAIHAPDVPWEECSSNNVFPNGDSSLPPSFTVLPNVIEKSQRVVIAHGTADFILIAEGYVISHTALAWQALSRLLSARIVIQK
jgi:carboxypeptidase D